MSPGQCGLSPLGGCLVRQTRVPRGGPEQTTCDLELHVRMKDARDSDAHVRVLDACSGVI